MVIVTYIFSLFICLLLSLNKYLNRNRLFIFLFFLFIITILRFDVGPDYEETFNLIYSSEYIIGVSSNIIFIKPDLFFFIYLSFLYKSISLDWFYIFFTYGLISYFLVYYICESSNQDFLSFVLFFASFGLFFILLDRIRQGVSILIFMYAIKYLLNNKIKKYLICIIFSSFFHFSSLWLIFLIFTKNIFFPRFLSLITVLILIILYYFNIFKPIVNLFYIYTPIYNEVYKESLSEGLTRNSGLSVVLISLFYSCYLYSKKISAQFRFLIFIGLCIFIISDGNLGLVRFSDYFLLLPIFYISINIFLSSKIKYFYLVLLFAFSSLQFYNRISNRFYDYRTVFSYEAKNLIFESRY